MNPAMNTSVRMDVDEGHLIRGLRAAFTSTEHVLTELMQNARRAGATEVRFTADEDTMVVKDNGSGIRDFQKLIRIGGSNWDEATAELEEPYGLGILSALFACERIRIRSGTTMLEADCKDILAQRPIALTTMPTPVDGTRITLIQHKLGEMLPPVPQSAGFPIQVIWNGEEIQRPNTLDETFDACSVGAIRFRTGSESHAYLQGLPIRWQSKLNHWNWHHGGGLQVMLHLDPRQFQGRFPDRDCLHNEDEAIQRIRKGIAEAAHAWLGRQKACLPVAEFVTWYAEACLAWAPELLDDLPCLPATWFVDLDATDLVVGDEYGIQYLTTGILQQHDIEARGAITDEAFEDTDSPPTISLAEYMRATRGYCIQAHRATSLAPTHWLHAALFEHDKLEVEPVNSVGEEACLYLFSWHATIHACEAVVLRYPGHAEVRVTESLIHGKTIFATSGDTGVVLQGSNFKDDMEQDNGGWEDAARREFAVAYARITGASAAERMRLVLAEVIERVPQELRGKAFTVTFTDRWAVEVTEA